MHLMWIPIVLLQLTVTNASVRVTNERMLKRLNDVENEVHTIRNDVIEDLKDAIRELQKNLKKETDLRREGIERIFDILSGGAFKPIVDHADNVDMAACSCNSLNAKLESIINEFKVEKRLSVPDATPKPEPKCRLSKVDAVIILDASTSVTEPNYKKMLKFCKDIVDKADIDSGSVRIGVVIYSTDVQIQFNLNQYRTADEVKAAIDKIPYIYGSGNSADALKTMHETMFTAANGDRPGVDNIAFMVTDGVSNINSRRTIPEAQAAMKKGIRVYAIGIGHTDTRELDGMGSEPKADNVFNLKQFDELNDVIEKIFGGAASAACAPDLPPVANAGSDIERRFPVLLITLDGRASTDDKAVVKYTWSLQEGTRIRTWDTATVNLDNQPFGVYTFTLTVEDEKGQRDNDTVKVTVLDPGAYNSDCKVNSDCQLGFVCITGTCQCESSFVWDMSSRRCKKVCRGSSETFKRHGDFDHQYAILKNRYTNCSYVDGNLELNSLEKPFDLGFLKDIEEVDGYVFIVNVFSNYLNLTKLRIIRGKELFKYNNESYSLYVALNYNPHNDAQGILELQFTSLSEIVRGKVLFMNNNLLCFVETIEWTDINPNTQPAVRTVYSNKNWKRPCRTCAAECYNEKTKEFHCWGSGKGMCQKLNYIKGVCSESCDGRCFGDQQNQCCHPECAAGCTGPKKTDCLACKHFYNDGSCDRHCPQMISYNVATMSWENNPLGRYAFGKLCVKDCPLYLVKDNSACVLKCPKDKQPDASNSCEKCDGTCKKNCPGLMTNEFLNSKNIEQFRNCTVIDGNLIIVKVSFTASTAHALNILKTDSIEYLGLVSLRQIRNGGTLIMFNSAMCYLNDLDMSIIYLSITQKFIQRNNSNQSICEAENKRCDIECSEHGCWGPGPRMCLRCKNKRLEGSNKCVASCQDEEMQYEVPDNMCKSCHEQCAVGCHGPNATQCTACKNVKFLGPNNTSECMSECPAPLLTAHYYYPDETKICRQCDPSCDEGRKTSLKSLKSPRRLRKSTRATSTPPS